MTRRQRLQRDERGTSLILALVFVFAVGVVLVAVGGLAANALLNTSNARVQRTSAQDAETAVNVATQYVRYIPAAALPSLPFCLPPTSAIPSSDPTGGANNVQVYCTIDTTSQARVVDFYACSSAQMCTTSNLMLHAQVTYNDLDAGGADNCFVDAAGTVTTSCGDSMSLDFWDVPGADN